MTLPLHSSKNFELAVAMLKKRMTSQELSARAGVHWVTISKILNRRAQPKCETAAKIAAALGTTPEALNLVDGDQANE